MNALTAAKLLALNRKFYQTFAHQFSATRRRLQPGVLRMLADIPLEAHILDLGCGNGELALALARRGQQGTYLGLDFSDHLLAEAQSTLVEHPQASYTFLQADLASEDWHSSLHGQIFDTIVAFAVLHHIPGNTLRQQILRSVHRLLAPSGTFVISVWQFLNSPRLRMRIQPWETGGLSEAQVEDGDYLLDWRQGGSGLRYAHHFSPAELNSLAQAVGFQVVAQYHSDGEGGQLGLYQIWKHG
ncbi:MAG: class I SAM-dependent methyltransferase [Anaerolineales bacterium]|nr:class I SAM-dependent methyltransferase [Anaerolineales bacterium]